VAAMPQRSDTKGAKRRSRVLLGFGIFLEANAAELKDLERGVADMG